MKTALTIGLISVTTLYGNFVELPKDTQIWQLPSYQRQQIRFFDEARTIPWIEPDGTLHTEKSWVSRYGSLNGGTLFDTNLFELDPTTSADLWWNLDASGFKLRYIVVNSGQIDGKIYHVTNLTSLSGNEILSTFDDGTIQTIALYGHIPTQPLSDVGATFILLLIALIPIVRKRNV